MLRRWLVLVAASCALVVGIATPTAHADEGVALSSDTVYRLDEDRPAVTVEATYSMTNTTPDRRVGGRVVEYYFFTSISVPIHDVATEIDVEVNGRDADFTVETDDGGLPYLDIELGYELRYDRTATIAVRSTLLGDPPRDPDSWIRVNPAYASFEVFGWADDGGADVRIETPVGWVTDYVGDELTERVEGGLTIHEAEAITPSSWGVLFTARRDAFLETSTVLAGDAEFEIRSWPGDEAWRTYAAEQIRDGLPVLEGLLGTPWPVDGRTVVIEASTPYLRGYAGFYDSGSDTIEIGEDLDRLTFLHELAHAWINGSAVADRWIIEGLAEELATRAAERLGDALAEPEPPDVTPFPLNTWGELETTDGVEDYGYATSFAVIRELYDEIGDDSTTEVLAAVLAGERAYGDEDGAVSATRRVGWREFLDLVEQIGGSTGLQGQYRDTVLTPDQVELLERRNEAVAAFEELADRGGSWFPPAGVRSAMAEWRIDAALADISDAHLALDTRDALQDTLAPIGLTAPATAERAYQETTGAFDDLRSRLDGLLQDAGMLVEARSRMEAALDRVGQESPELTQATYDESPAAALTTALADADDAERLAATMSDLDAVLTSHSLTVPPLGPTAFADDRAAALATAQDLLAAATVVAAAHDAAGDADSPFETIGGWWSEIDAHLAAADSHLAAGDTTAAIAEADAAAAGIDGLAASGVRRTIAAAGVTLLIGVAVVVARRRRASNGHGDPLPPPDPADSAHDAPPPAPGQADVGQAGAVDPDH